MSAIGNSGARSSGPIGSSVPGCRTGGGGAGRSASRLYQRLGSSDSASVILVAVMFAANHIGWTFSRSWTPATAMAVAGVQDRENACLRNFAPAEGDTTICKLLDTIPGDGPGWLQAGAA